MSAGAGPRFDVQFGQYRASSDARQSDRQLLTLVVELAMDGMGGRCVLELAGADYAPVEPDDTVTVKLDNGNGAVPVFTGTAYAMESSAASQVVRAIDNIGKLAAKLVEAAYEDVTADFIISDVLDQAGVTPGTVSPGTKLSSYVLHAGPSALGHLRRLADLTGSDIFTDRSGKVHVATPKQGSADHSFKFGETILALDLRRIPPAFDGVVLWGEGAASAKGSDKAHWLCTDLSGVKAEAAVGTDGEVQTNQSGTAPRRISDGAIRTGSAAADAAKARATASASRLVQGRIEVLGRPEIEPGDLVAITGLPDGHAAVALLNDKPLRVRSVRHTLSRQTGLRTRLEF